mgnify:CR=1 FL=1
MASQITNYKCPACTGPLHFVGASGMLECDFCGAKYDVAQIEAMYAEKEAAAVAATEKAEKKAEANRQKLADMEAQGWDTSGLNNEWGAEADGMKAYSCPSCGAELICDETTAATSCPYCGNPTVVPGQFSGALKPEFVLPFKMTKDDAVRALRAHYRGKPFLPRSFTAGNHIEEIQGVYVPFWLFDGGAEGEVDYKAANSRTYKDDDYEITETDHYDVRRAGSIAFEKIPVDASSKMPDDHMDSIEPFDYTQMQPFSTAYLPGFLADRYDEDEEKCLPRATRRMENTTRAALRETIDGYSEVHTKAENINIDIRKAHYALLPVWMLHTRWNDKDFLFAMNGQTGKLIGDLPVDPKRVAAWFAGISLPLMVILALFLYG